MKTKLTYRILLLYPTIILLVSSFYTIVFFGIIKKYFNIAIDKENIQIFLLFIIVVSSISLIIWRYRRYRYFDIWELTNNILYRGNPVNLELKLDNIDKVILGLPKNNWIKIITSKILLKEQAIVASAYDATIILKFKDNTYLPLYIFDFKNGLEISNKILKLLQNRIDDEYTFTQEEANFLKPKNRNKLLSLVISL